MVLNCSMCSHEGGTQSAPPTVDQTATNDEQSQKKQISASVLPTLSAFSGVQKQRKTMEYSSPTLLRQEKTLLKKRREPLKDPN